MSFDEVVRRIRAVHGELQQDEEQWKLDSDAAIAKNPDGDLDAYKTIYDQSFAIAERTPGRPVSQMVAGRLVPIIAEAIRKDALPEILASAIRRYVESDSYSGKYKQLIALMDYLEDRYLEDKRYPVYGKAPRPLDRLADAMQAAADARHKVPTKRRRQQQRQITEKQLEAIDAVNDCEGNFSAAAKRLGVNRKTVKQHYYAGMRNVGDLAVKLVKPKTHSLESKRRGALPVAGKDDGPAAIGPSRRTIRDQRQS